MTSVTKAQDPAEREFEEFLAALDWAQNPARDDGRRTALSNQEFDRLLDAFRSLERTEPPSATDHEWMNVFTAESGEDDPAARWPVSGGTPPAAVGKTPPETVAGIWDLGRQLADGYGRLLSGDAAMDDGRSSESARLLALSTNVQIQVMRAREGSALLVLVDGHVFGLPLKYVDRIECVSLADPVNTSGSGQFIDGDKILPVLPFGNETVDGNCNTKEQMRYLVIIDTGYRRVALPVDAHLGAHEVGYGEMSGLFRGNKWLAGRGRTRNGLDVYIVDVPALAGDIDASAGES